MWLRLTIDLDMKIHDAEAATDAGPYSPCGDITPNFKALKGVTIGAGWRRKTLELLGGIKGCTHLVELLGPLGTTAFQATGRAREKHNAGKPVTREALPDERMPHVQGRRPGGQRALAAVLHAENSAAGRFSAPRVNPARHRREHAEDTDAREREPPRDPALVAAGEIEHHAEHQRRQKRRGKSRK